MVDSPAKRSRLAPRRNPYWQPCGAKRGGLSLGYRKPERGAGAWIARLIREGERAEHRLGDADDAEARTGALPYAQAVSAAIEWGARQGAASAAAKRGDGSPLTLRAAVAAYVEERKAKSKRDGRNAETRLAKHLLAGKRLADRPLAKLTEHDLTDWAKGLSGMAGTTAARLLNDARAALNRAHDLHHRALPPGWRETVARGLRRRLAGTVKGAPVASHHRAVLTDADMRKIVETALAHDDGGDFGRLVAVLAATGARFSQIARLTVADVIDGPAPRLMVPSSRKGRDPSRKASHVPVPVGADLLALLRPVTAGRAGAEPLLMRWLLKLVPGDKEAKLPKRWMRDRRMPWRDAFEMTPFWKEALARTGIAGAVEPYRLRDASIIRGLRAGQPVRLVAAQHDTSVAMIEKHYAQHISDALADLARTAVVPVVTAAPATLRTVS